MYKAAPQGPLKSLQNRPPTCVSGAFTWEFMDLPLRVSVPLDPASAQGCSCTEAGLAIGAGQLGRLKLGLERELTTMAPGIVV